MPKPNSLAGRIKHLLDTGNGADVHFLVGGGDEKELLPAHKLILMAASDVFEAMFPFDARNADPSEETKPVEVPDVEVGAFKAMLSFIYADDVRGLNGDNAIAVLYAAKKYNLPELVDSCLNFPIPELSNVFFAFAQTRFLGEEIADALILSEEFLQIDQKLLCELLDRDQLFVCGEIAIWNAALRWADEKCRQNGRERSAANRREMLGPALFKIRFPLISQEDFSEIIVPSGVLTEGEMLSIFMYYSGPKRARPNPYQLQFRTNGRAGTKSGLTLQNRWNIAECHRSLVLSGPNRLIAQLTRENKVTRTIRAERPIPKRKFGIFYYEVTVMEKGRIGVYIGLATKEMPLDERVGVFKGTYAYDSWGQFWGHEVEGCSHYDGRPVIVRKPSFGLGDVIGCSVNLASRQLIYTKNGQRLEAAGLFVYSGADLFPCVTLFNSGAKIEANFGPNFKFNIAADGI
ncbi:hypothetical protein GPALN_013111 [Globodera pallida]|nr:hypothetical protein GPALN_013111 [Globodera pallida]